MSAQEAIQSGGDGGSRPRLLVVGASGLVGGALLERAKKRHEALGVDRSPVGDSVPAMDLGDPAQVERTLAGFRPDVVAICSAWPWVDGCEADPARSHRENVDTVKTLVAATHGTGATLVFFSTDHVFDGARPSYVESDPVNPLSVYAKHKREVEELLLARGRSLIVRTAWVFGEEERRKNFLYQVVAASRSGTPLKLPVGQAGCPTWSRWLADSVLELLRAGTEGIAHLTGGEPLTKAEWARLIVGELGLAACQLVELPWEEAGQVAPRPERVVLRSERHVLTQPSLASILRAERSIFTSP